MKIINVEGFSTEQLEEQVKRGGRLVYFPYTVSLILFTFKLKSELYLIKPNQKATRKGLPFLLISLFFGWWGIPFGPKETMKSLSIIRKGGKDITEEVLSIWAGRALFREAEKEKAVAHA